LDIELDATMTNRPLFTTLDTAISNQISAVSMKKSHHLATNLQVKHPVLTLGAGFLRFLVTWLDEAPGGEVECSSEEDREWEFE
jgi:hypothetical protein